MILQKNQCFIASDRNHVWFEKVTVRLCKFSDKEEME